MVQLLAVACDGRRVPHLQQQALEKADLPVGIRLGVRYGHEYVLYRNDAALGHRLHVEGHVPAVDESVELLAKIRTGIDAKDHLPVAIKLINMILRDPFREITVKKILEAKEDAVRKHLARSGHQVAVDLVRSRPVLLHVAHLVNIRA